MGKKMKSFWCIIFISFFLIGIGWNVYVLASEDEVKAFIKDLDFNNMEKRGWILIWENSESRVLVNPSYEKKIKDKIYFLAKISPGKEKEDRIRKNFEKQKEKLIKEGFEIGPYWEEMVKDAIESNSYYQIFSVNCEKKELLIHPFGKDDETKVQNLNITAIFKIEITPGGYGDALFKRYCENKK